MPDIKPFNTAPKDRPILGRTTDGEWIPIRHSEGDIWLHVDGEWDGIFPSYMLDGWQEITGDPSHFPSEPE